MSDIGAILGAVLATTNALGAGGMDGPNHAENYRKWENRAACAEYALEVGSRDWQGAAWQCGVIGDGSITGNNSRAIGDVRSLIIMWQNALQ